MEMSDPGFSFLIGKLILIGRWHGRGGRQQREEPAGQVTQHQGHEGGGRGLQVSARDFLSVLRLNPYT